MVGYSEKVLPSLERRLRGKVQLVFTSPPFPLIRRKKYNNLSGKAYVEWLASFAEPLRELLTPTGSIVIEVGNAWTPGLPTMATTPIESLLAFKARGNLHLCQEFIWHNPAKLPTPAEWVAVRRERLKDSFTRLWWLSPTPHPKADNRKVLVDYSPSMTALLKRGTYNSGERPSEHRIGKASFLSQHPGAIAPSFLSLASDSSALCDADGSSGTQGSALQVANTNSNSTYRSYCKTHGLSPHPATMPEELVGFFIELTTEPGDLVLDPFAGSNTTGAVAERLKRKWLSIEAREDYIGASRGRFEGLGTKAPRKKK